MARFTLVRGLGSGQLLGASLLCAVGSLAALAGACSSADDSDDGPSAGTKAPPVAGQSGAPSTGGTMAPNSTGGAGGVGGQTGQPMGGRGGAGGVPDTMGGGTGGSVTRDGGVDAAIDMGEHVPTCIDDAKDVVLIGDSYIDWITHTFVADIRAESGQEWPSYAIGGTSMATGGIGHIPDQLDTALADNPTLKVIVMTGGGNDILVYDGLMFPDGAMCTSVPNAPMIEDCKKIVKAALDEASALLDKTADKGVRDVVYFFYPHIPGGGLISGPTPNAILDYAMPMARDVCESALVRTGGRMNCHFVDTVPVFEGKTGLFADENGEEGDGVHPNSMGSKVIAKEVWRVMKENCLAQPTGSGCCQAP